MGFAFATRIPEGFASDDIAIFEWAAEGQERAPLEETLQTHSAPPVIILTPLGCPELMDLLPYPGKYRCVTIPVKAAKLEEALRDCATLLNLNNFGREDAELSNV